MGNTIDTVSSAGNLTYAVPFKLILPGCNAANDKGEELI